MLPARFTLHRPGTIAEALDLVTKYGEDATFYAGGTELILALKARVLRYGHLIDLKGVTGLAGVEERDDGTIAIGALTTHHELATSSLVRRTLSAYAELSEGIANIRVRVTGTLAGNLCFAEPHADPPALLCALGARVVLASPVAERILNVADFIQGEFTTARAAGELLVRVEVPRVASGMRAAYRSFAQHERPTAGVAAIRRGRDDWQFWCGAVASRPILLGTTPERLSEAVERIEAHDDMHGSADYKRHLVGVLAKRAMQACLT